MGNKLPTKTAKILWTKCTKRLYEVDPPMEYSPTPYWKDHECVFPPPEKTNYVVASKAVVSDMPKTYLFAANKEGRVICWLELEGSFRGDLDFDKAIQKAGYTVVPNQQEISSE